MIAIATEWTSTIHHTNISINDTLGKKNENAYVEGDQGDTHNVE